MHGYTKLDGWSATTPGTATAGAAGQVLQTLRGLPEVAARVQAAEDVMRAVCRRDAVRCVSFRQLTDWLEAQDPAVIGRLLASDP